MNRNSSGRRYDREFKNNAVELVRGGRTITEVARDLGVSNGRWGTGCGGPRRAIRQLSLRARRKSFFEAISPHGLSVQVRCALKQ
jgi:hypothetical protein